MIVLDANILLDADGVSDVANPVTYTGRRFDPETGFYYYRNRYYHAQMGRFASRDPIGFEGSKWNLHQYVGSNPCAATDPLGLEDPSPLYPPGYWDKSSPAPGGKCGPDVTDKVNAAVDDLEGRLRALGQRDPAALMRKCDAAWTPTWEFYPISGDQGWDFTDGGLPEGEACKGTVTYNGHCYRTFNISYILWGRGQRVCEEFGHTSPFPWNLVGESTSVWAHKYYFGYFSSAYQASAAAQWGQSSEQQDLEAMERHDDTNCAPSTEDTTVTEWWGHFGGQPFGHHPDLRGDANYDGVFDKKDLAHVLEAGKYKTGQPATPAQGDWNGDGVFDQKDIIFAMDKYRD